MATERKGNIDVRAQSAKGAKVVSDAQGGSFTLFGVKLDGGLDSEVNGGVGVEPGDGGRNTAVAKGRGTAPTGYVTVDGVTYKVPKINNATLEVLKNRQKSIDRQALWQQHDAERRERVAKGYAALDRAVAAINKGIQEEDAKRHPLKAVHWNAKAGKAPWNPQDVAEVKDKDGNVTTKGSKAGTEYEQFKKKFESWVNGLVIDPSTGKNSEGRMRYGDSGSTLQKYKDLGVVTYDRDGNQVVNWNKVTSQEQVDVLKGEMEKDDEFQGRMIAEQRQREAKTVADARNYAKQNGVTLPKDATDAQVIRTVFADKAQKAADAVNEGDAGAANRMYGAARIHDAAGLKSEGASVGGEAAGAGLSALDNAKVAVQQAATEAKDAATNKEGDISDALREQIDAGRKINVAVQKGNDEAEKKIADAEEAKLSQVGTAKQKKAAEQKKPEEGQA